MNQKKENRVRRGKRTRIHIRNMKKPSLVVTKTSKHIYAQIIDGTGQKILATASTVQPSVKDGLKYTGNVEAAIKVGTAIAEIAKSKGLTEIVFDRNGFLFHGRVAALANAARDAGLKF